MRYANQYGTCEIDDLPGCTQVAVSHSVFIKFGQRGKGHGNRNHVLRLLRMSQMGYDAALCTVVSTNVVQKHLLKKNGWQYCNKFKSSKTGSTVELWFKTLNPMEDAGGI